MNLRAYGGQDVTPELIVVGVGERVRFRDFVNLNTEPKDQNQATASAAHGKLSPRFLERTRSALLAKVDPPGKPTIHSARPTQSKRKRSVAFR